MKKNIILTVALLSALPAFNAFANSQSVPPPPPVSGYDLLDDQRDQPIGPKNWLGNLKWYAQEVDKRMSLVFRTNPKDQAAAEYVAADQIQSDPESGATFPSARRTFFRLSLPEGETIEKCAYRPDSIEARTSRSDYSVTMPLHSFGSLIQLRSRGAGNDGGLTIESGRLLGSRLVTPAPLVVHASPGRMVWIDGPYTVVFRYNGDLQETNKETWLLRPTGGKNLRLAVAFHIDPKIAGAEADRLFDKSAEACAESRREWNEYLASCPVTDFPKGYQYVERSTGKSVEISRQRLQERQLWHWACVLVNVYDIDFNNMPALMTPDKCTWFGCWANDSAEALRALAHTNQKELVRKCLVNYVRVAINADGDMTWYLHGIGVPALGNPRDLGRLSHGVPALITALAEYVNLTNDLGILSEPAGDGQTVWEKVRNYVRQVFPHRDLNGDGLVEWSQLWEGGADDKVGPFFSSADIGAWVKAIEKLSPPEFEKFHETHVRPVVNIYEQHFFLYALNALTGLAEKNHDPETAKLAKTRMEGIISVLQSRHWDDKDGFYYDWDVKAGALAKVKNQDAFYLLRFLPDRERAARMVRYLDDPKVFGTLYLPTLAINEPGFKANGYWCGGYWPREACSMAWGLAAAGEASRAEEMLIKALCCAEGKAVLENVNPITGKASTRNLMIAYGALLNVALHEIHPAAEPKTCTTPAPTPPSVVPVPVKMQAGDGEFAITPDTVVEADEASTVTARQLADYLKPAIGFVLNVATAPVGEKPRIALKRDSGLSRLGKEGYRLVVTPESIQISAADQAGMFYGVQTLLQLLPTQVFSTSRVEGVDWKVPCVQIEDKPRFAWRGLMLDTGHDFQEIGVVYRFIDRMALHKFNVFHWHLTDLGAWSLEIKGHPKLLQQSTRVTGSKSGFYTQEQVREVVRYAANRYITVIPEVDMPGHATPALMAYPELDCQTDVPAYIKLPRFEYCVGNEKTYQFLQEVLTQVVDLFPSTYVHIGGDECPKKRWKSCPVCQKKIKTENLKNEEELQSYFIRRIEKFLNGKGRRIIGWEEILEGGLAPNATVMSWRGTEKGIKAAKAGHDVVMAPNPYLYFDYSNNKTPLEKVYSYNPVPSELNPEEARHILGAQAQMWTDHHPSEKEMEQLLYPRACAVAELLWSDPRPRNFDDFRNRLLVHQERLKLKGINVFPLSGGAALQK
jgi:N-acetyl-beta-hexosaminidase